MTPLMTACACGHTEVVKMLLDYSDTNPINFNAKDNYGQTAFFKASAWGHKDIVQVLLSNAQSKNIKLNVRDNLGDTAFSRACNNLWICPDTVKHFLEYSDKFIDYNAGRPIHGVTIGSGFYIACLIDYFEIVEVLLEYAKKKNLIVPTVDQFDFLQPTTQGILEKYWGKN